MPTPRDELERQFAEHEEWYHTIELALGLVTPGWFDLRGVPDRIPFPKDLTGKRCLDVGTFDGFWAFTMEDRGADDIVAIDVWDEAQFDWPLRQVDEAVRAMARRKGGGRGFEIAAAARDSKVVRHELSVYDLEAAELGTFDFVYLGSLLLHLKNPIGALEKVRAVCTGHLLLVDAVDAHLTRRHPRTPVMHFDGIGRPWWWKPNEAGLARMLESADFEILAGPSHIDLPPGPGRRRPRLRNRLRSLPSRARRDAIRELVKGDPQAAVLARPRT